MSVWQRDQIGDMVSRLVEQYPAGYPGKNGLSSRYYRHARVFLSGSDVESGDGYKIPGPALLPVPDDREYAQQRHKHRFGWWNKVK